MVLFIVSDNSETRGSACARPLQAADTLQWLTPQAALVLLQPHPRRSCDFHMVSLPSLFSYKSEDTGRGKNVHGCQRIWEFTQRQTGNMGNKHTTESLWQFNRRVLTLNGPNKYNINMQCLVNKIFFSFIDLWGCQNAN